MNIIVCLDDNGGMLFNQRRQSRDRIVTADILSTTSASRLLISSFSEKLFENSINKPIADDNFLSIAGKGDFCFVENRKLAEYEKDINTIIVYRWNRMYPSDFTFDLNLAQWKLISAKEFTGYSHKKITKEVYEK
ncbi:MAG: ribonuclease Z [Lachnospiraceae bacterium]